MKDSKFYKIIIMLLSPIFKMLYRLEVRGKENLPKSQKMIICPNHTSNADPILLAISVNYQIFFMAKAPLFKFKPFAAILKKLGAFAVYRGKKNDSAVNRAVELLEQDKPLGIFIEGTRSKNAQFLRPKSGPALLSCTQKCPVIPVYINQLPMGRVKVFKKNILVFGKPLSFDEDLGLFEGTPAQLKNASRNIMKKIEEIREEVVKECE